MFERLTFSIFFLPFCCDAKYLALFFSHSTLPSQCRTLPRHSLRNVSTPYRTESAGESSQEPKDA